MIFSLDIVENISSVLLVIVFSIIANEGFSRILFFISNLGLFDEKKNNLLKKYMMKIYQLDIYKNKVIYKIEIRYLKTRKIAYCTKWKNSFCYK